MPFAKITIDASQLETLAKRFNQFPKEIEKAVNPYLHSEAPQTMEDEIRRLMPVSTVSKSSPWSSGSLAIRAKDHAKTSGSIVQGKINLGFYLKTTPKYGYLIFPEEGRGKKQIRKGAQLFFRFGADNTTDPIVNRLYELTGRVLQIGIDR